MKGTLNPSIKPEAMQPLQGVRIGKAYFVDCSHYNPTLETSGETFREGKCSYCEKKGKK